MKKNIILKTVMGTSAAIFTVFAGIATACGMATGHWFLSAFLWNLVAIALWLFIFERERK